MAGTAPLVEYNPTIKQLPEGERPRERLELRGEGVLLTAELLAIILRVGTRDENVIRLAERLLVGYEGLAGLARAPFSELVAVKGLGPAKVTQLKAAFELGRRLLAADPQSRITVTVPQDAANLIMAEMSAFEQEHLQVLVLNTRHQVLRIYTIYVGSLNSAVVRVGELFREAVRNNAAALIIAHNPPSGDPTPSADDVGVTRQCVEAGRLLDIEVLDHLVIGDGKFVSMKERGLGF
jgi:DNA repair protein RadC